MFHSISYKVKKEEVKTALNILNDHEQFTMSELLMMMKEKYKDFDISQQHLGVGLYYQQMHVNTF